MFNFILDFLKDWVVNILIIVIICIIFDLLLPNSTIRKYANVVIGFIVIVSIINPFLSLFTGKFYLEKTFLRKNIELNKMLEINSEDIIKDKNKEIINVYKERLKEEIKFIIYDRTDYVVKYIDLKVVEDDNDKYFGNIKKLILKVEPKDKRNKSKIKKIEKINVDVNVALGKAKKESTEECIELKKFLSRYYKIPDKDLIVYLTD